MVASSKLSKFKSPYWYWFTAFVGFSLFQLAFTGFCLMENILRGLRVRAK